MRPFAAWLTVGKSAAKPQRGSVEQIVTAEMLSSVAMDVLWSREAPANEMCRGSTQIGN